MLLLVAIVWTDIGRDLSVCNPGPWSPVAGAPSRTTYIHPVLQHRPYLAPSEQPFKIDTTESPLHGWQASQNASLLHSQYGQFLNKEILPLDALYSLHDVFRLAAAAEGHYLNLITDIYQHEVEVARKSPTYASSMRNLQYLKKSVDEHVEKLSEVASWLNNRHHLDWPKVQPGGVHYDEAERAANLLEKNFMHLELRASRLSNTCQEGIGSLVQLSAFQESVKTVGNAERVEKLIRLATIFLPLSFTCSFFGMNVSKFGQGPLSVWVYFPTTAGFLRALYSLWRFWDLVRYLRLRLPQSGQYTTSR